MQDLSLDDAVNDPVAMPNTFGQVQRTPLVLSALWTEITRVIYSEEVNLLANISTWSPTNEKGHVYIQESYVFDDENTDRRPAIIVDIGDLQYKRIRGLGDASDFDLEEGEAFYFRHVVGSVVWAHLSESRGQAMLYAGNTQALLDAFSAVIRREFCFDKLEIRATLKPRQRKDRPLEFESLVQADFLFQERFGVKHESPKLKALTFKAVTSDGFTTDI